MLLTKTEARTIYYTHVINVTALVTKLLDLRTSNDDYEVNKFLAIIYKEILEQDSDAVIFNTCFAKCASSAGNIDEQDNLEHFKKILPLYLTYKDIGYAHLQLLTDESDINVEPEYISIFKTLGNIKVNFNSIGLSNVDIIEPLFSSILLTSVLQERASNINEQKLQDISSQASNITVAYTAPLGIAMLSQGRSQIVSQWDSHNLLHSTALQLLKEYNISKHLQSDMRIADISSIEISKKILIEDAEREAQMSIRKAMLEQRKLESLESAKIQSEHYQKQIKQQHNDSITDIHKQLSNNLATIHKQSADRIHDIEYCNAAGNMFNTANLTRLTAPGAQQVTVGLSFSSSGNDITASHTVGNNFGQSTTNWSYQSAVTHDMQLKTVEAQRLNIWWDTQVTHQKQQEYIHAIYSIPLSNIITGDESQLWLDPNVNIINPYVATIITGNEDFLAHERQATAGNHSPINLANNITNYSATKETTKWESFKAFVTKIVEHDMSAVKIRIAERDKMLRDVYGPGYIPESSLATIGLVAIGTATKQLVQDGVQIASTIIDVCADTHASIYSASDIHKVEAWNRNQERLDNLGQAISNVIDNPSIIPVYYKNNMQDAFNSFATAYENGDLIGAGNAAGQVLYDVSAIYSVAAVTSKVAGGAAKYTGKFLKANEFRSPILFQYDGPRLYSGISFDEVKLQNPVVKKVAPTDIANTTFENVVNLNVQHLSKIIEDYLGKDFRMIKNADGDVIFINSSNTKKIRFDINDPHGYLPHGHVEAYDSTLRDWIDLTDQHMIYLSDTVKPIFKPKN